MRALSILNTSTALTLVLLGTGAFGANAAAQTTTAASAQPTAAGPAPAASSEPVGLAEVVVTAQRRSENLQRAAIAVTAIQSTTLARAGVTDVTQLATVMPALQVSTVAGPVNSFYMRGVGNFTANSLSNPAISFNIDGVTLAQGSAAQAVFYDLDRVEVLKGPQGTLYGRNATGGAINVITAKPQLGEFSGFMDAEYGNFNAFKLTGAVNAPVGEHSALRVAGQFSKHDGYYSDGSGDDDTKAVRAQFASEITPDFKLTMGADYAHQGGIGPGSTIHGLPLDQRIGVTDPRAGAVYASSFDFAAGAYLHPLVNDAFYDNTYWGAYAQADVKTPLGTLTVIPAYRDVQQVFRSYGSGFAFNGHLRDHQVSMEARLASDAADRLSYIVGFYFLDEDAKEANTTAAQYFDIFPDFHSTTKSYAGFGRVTFRVTDKLRLTGGLRYTIDDKSADLDATSASVICPASFTGGSCVGTPALPNSFDLPPAFAAPPGATIVAPWGTSGAIVAVSRQPITPSQTFNRLTYRAGVEYDLGPQSLLYATYETGFKSGGFFYSIDNPVYRPETIDAITVGSKNRFLDNRLQLNIEGFYWNYKNQQVSHVRLNSQGGIEFVTENVGSTKIGGVEVESRALVRPDTILNLTVQYLHARYDNFIYANPAVLGPPVTSCPFKPNPSGSLFVVDCSGRTPLNAPTWTISGGVEQAFELSDGGRLVFNADGHYQTESYTGFEQLPSQLQKAYFTADLQLRYEAPRSGLSIAGFANNVTNTNVVSFSSPLSIAPSLVLESLRPPRTYGVRVGYKF